MIDRFVSYFSREGRKRRHELAQIKRAKQHKLNQMQARIEMLSSICSRLLTLLSICHQSPLKKQRLVESIWCPAAGVLEQINSLAGVGNGWYRDPSDHGSELERLIHSRLFTSDENSRVYISSSSTALLWISILWLFYARAYRVVVEYKGFSGYTTQHVEGKHQLWKLDAMKAKYAINQSASLAGTQCPEITAFRTWILAECDRILALTPCEDVAEFQYSIFQMTFERKILFGPSNEVAKKRDIPIVKYPGGKQAFPPDMISLYLNTSPIDAFRDFLKELSCINQLGAITSKVVEDLQTIIRPLKATVLEL